MELYILYIVRSWVAVIHLVRQYVCAKTKLGRGWRDEQRRGLKAKTTGGYILGQILKFYPRYSTNSRGSLEFKKIQKKNTGNLKFSLNRWRIFSKHLYPFGIIFRETMEPIIYFIYQKWKFFLLFCLRV